MTMKTSLAKGSFMRTFLRTFIVGAVLAAGGGVAASAASAPADEITNWNQMLFRAGLVGGTTPLVIKGTVIVPPSCMYLRIQGVVQITPKAGMPALICGRDLQINANNSKLIRAVKIFMRVPFLADS